MIIRVSEEERQMIGSGASKRRKTISDYLRWLASVDRETRYRLTDEGRAILEGTENCEDDHK